MYAAHLFRGAQFPASNGTQTRSGGTSYSRTSGPEYLPDAPAIVKKSNRYGKRRLATTQETVGGYACAATVAGRVN
jgi:hypothetical protein